jgi:hypothetical protein
MKLKKNNKKNKQKRWLSDCRKNLNPELAGHKAQLIMNT